MMIYVYKMWDFWGGYWTEDTPQRRESVDDSDCWYFIDEEDYRSRVSSVPRSGNIAEL